MEQELECNHEWETFFVMNNVQQSKKIKRCILCGEEKYDMAQK